MMMISGVSELQPVGQVKFYYNTTMLFVCLLHMAAFTLLGQSGAVVTEIVWVAKPKIFIIYPLQKMLPGIHRTMQRAVHAFMLVFTVLRVICILI